ncbi:unnamed protein product [Adineta steineri]|uniref:EGF-like domain-containing protein n=1 Tax=Adineta steineri TaxID=433720 RepID=A0A813VZC3_9BILA|nr:unnamed protein product [Adineta steineri]CAF1171353.1 unnamed protein product [Adineta steineri]
MTNVSVNQLLQWHIPLDIADLYGAFLSNNLYNDHRNFFICNCSSVSVFGRYCEYEFEEGIYTIENLINSSINEKKTYYPKERLLPCYDLEIENNERCLDYRDICDGEFDTINGHDELYCDQIETNICESNEFRCRNGFCIDRQFLFDDQGDCTDLSDEQNLLIHKKYHNFQTCYEQASFDCDEHWCGRDMISCGDGECVPWYQRFWNGFDCHNYYTHVYNCELELVNSISVDFSITGNNGRCTTDIRELTEIDDKCVLMIKCFATLHPTCKSLEMLFNRSKYAAAHAHYLCQNHTLIKYASGIAFLSPFIRAYHVPLQFQITGELDFFAKMKMKQPGLFCLTGEYTCRGIKVTHNGSTCFKYDDIFEKSYPFPPYEYLFCQTINDSIDYCTNTTFFYLCRTSGECISKYRLFDGFIDCLDASDENDLEALDSLEPFFMKDRYNCTQNGDKSTAVMRHFLGDGINQCMNGADEMSLSINWQQQQCFKSSDSACILFRDLYNANKEDQPIHVLRFNSLCDSIWDLRNGSDETDCNEWICEPGYTKQQTNLNQWSGNCINPAWQCNGIWDYTDGSDEFNCNRSEQYPIPNCLLLKTGKIILLNESNMIAGNGHVDCSGGIDERVTYACNDGFPLNERFLCNDKITCLNPMYLCNHVNDCADGEDENEFWCGSRPSFNSSFCKPKTFACQERDDFGPCIPHEDRCRHDHASCGVSHKDKHMCVRPRKYNHKTFEQRFFPLPEMNQTQLNRTPAWFCDRGLLVRRYDKLACLCPPSFFGHRCEKHSHRLTVIFTLQIGIIKTDLIRIIVLLINQNETIDHIVLTQLPSYMGKHRIYLNYPRSQYSDLRQATSQYAVQFRLYAIDNSTIRRLFVTQYPIKHSYLPAFRIAIVLRYNDDDSYSNQFNNHYKQNSSNCSCASNSKCLILANQYITCICTSQQYGPTCHLQTPRCPINFCQNYGTCISYTNDFYNHEYRCICSSNHFGEYCQYEKAKLLLDLRNETISSSTIRIVQLLNYDLLKMQLNIERQHLMLKSSETILHNDLQLPSIGLLKEHEPIFSNIYLLYLSHNSSEKNLTQQNKIKCIHAKEFDLIPTNYSYDALLFVMKRYHRPCQQLQEKKTKTICFYDPHIYFCFCNETTRRSLCFIYDFKYDRCNECLNDGQCYAGERKTNKKEFICRCKPCIYGALCEFRMDRLKYSFESLLILDVTSTHNEINFTTQSGPKSITWIYMSICIIMTIVGLLSNTCTYLALNQQKNTRSIISRYIQMTAIVNQLILICLLIQIIYIILNQYNILSNSFINLFFFKWFTAFLSISRARLTNQIHIYSRKQYIWLLIIIITILSLNATEVIFHRLINDPRKPNYFICTVEILDHQWNIFETIFRITNHIIPFLLNIYAVITIIRTVARSKSNIHKTNFVSEIWKQIKQYYEQLACPILIIMCSAPELLMILIIKCHQWDNTPIRTSMIIMHFVSFVPQMLSYYLFIQPSTVYRKAFIDNTRIGQILYSIIQSS